MSPEKEWPSDERPEYGVADEFLKGCEIAVASCHQTGGSVAIPWWEERVLQWLLRILPHRDITGIQAGMPETKDKPPFNEMFF